jgi:hypothetical protein
MSKDQAKEFAQKFIDEQKRILEEFGDSAVASKCKEAVASAQKLFQELSAKAKTEKIHSSR